LPNHFHYGRATVGSLFIDALQIAVNDVKVFFVRMEMH